MTPKALQKLLKRWQKTLGLGHWDIELKLVRSIEGGSEGLCKPQAPYLMATIYLLDPKVHPNPKYYNIEETLVHELIHCHMAPLNLPDDQGELEEQIVTTLSRAFTGSASFV